MDLNVAPADVRAAADRWRMIVNDLGEGGTPLVGQAMTWPSGAATDAIDAEAAGATEAFQARISETAAGSDAAANAHQNREIVGAADIKDIISAVASPAANVAGNVAGSMGAVSGAVIGTIAALGTSSLVNALAGSHGHVGSPPQTPPLPAPIEQPQEGFESGEVE
jgi:hypothetical protein